MNKKAYLWKNWPETFGLILLIIGFIFAAWSDSAVVSYLIIFFCGAIIGRIWFRIKKNLKFPWLIITVGFLIGFVLGSFYGNKIIIILCYIIGILISYYLHSEKIIESREY